MGTLKSVTNTHILVELTAFAAETKSRIEPKSARLRLMN